MTFPFSTSASVVFLSPMPSPRSTPRRSRGFSLGRMNLKFPCSLPSSILWVKHRHSLSRNTRIYRLLTSLKLMSPDLSEQDQRYTLLSEEPEPERQSPRKDRGMSTGWVVSLFAVGACVLSIATFAAGRHSVSGNLAHDSSSAPDPFDGGSPETVVLEFNETFGIIRMDGLSVESGDAASVRFLRLPRRR